MAVIAHPPDPGSAGHGLPLDGPPAAAASSFADKRPSARRARRSSTVGALLVALLVAVFAVAISTPSSPVGNYLDPLPVPALPASTTSASPTLASVSGDFAEQGTGKPTLTEMPPLAMSLPSPATDVSAHGRAFGLRGDRDAWVNWDARAGKLFGMYTNLWPHDAAAWDEATASLGGLRPSAQMWFVRTDTELSVASLTRSHDMGALPILSVEPCFFGSLPDEKACALDRIVAGDFDAELTALASTIRNSGVVVGVRFAHEMNGGWYPWGTIGSNTPDDYVAAWRHVHALFAAAGADAVIWIWSVNITTGGEDMAQFYPGDDYVDWLGLSGFFLNFDPNPDAPLNPDYETLLGADIDAMREFSDLPVLITETGADGAGGQKERFITDFFAGASADDDVIGFIWYNKAVPPWRADVRFNSTEAALAAFNAGIRNGSWAVNLVY